MRGTAGRHGSMSRKRERGRWAVARNPGRGGGQREDARRVALGVATTQHSSTLRQAGAAAQEGCSTTSDTLSSTVWRGRVAGQQAAKARCDAVAARHGPARRDGARTSRLPLDAGESHSAARAAFSAASVSTARSAAARRGPRGRRP